MTGKQLILNVHQGLPVPRAPWVPFAGVHAGQLKGYTATEVLKDEDKLFESLMEVHRLYQPDGQPVVFDLQLEAEILGCDLLWDDKAPPSVASHPLAVTDDIPEQKLRKEDGRLPMVLSVMERMKDAVGDQTALYGLVCGPFTLASHLRGTELFMDMILKPDYVHRLLAYTTDICLQMVAFYDEAGMDVLAPVDPLVSQISPEHFRQFLHEPYKTVFNVIRERERASSFFVCGNAIRNIEEMCLTVPDALSIDENIRMEEAKQITDRYGIAIGGNIPLTTTMLFGNQQDNMKVVIDLMDSVGKEGLIVAPGCDMPYDVPIQNAVAVAQAVRQPEQVREMIANYQAETVELEVALPDYDHLERPLLEVFTLDSATCAACTYMMAVAMDAKEHFGERLDVVEYKYNVLENIARCKKMGVTNLPAIYLNGELKYSSIIPSRAELHRQIENVI